jgi:cytochrome P450
MPAPAASAADDAISTSPGPSGAPLVGNLPEFAKDPLGFFVRMREEHGDIVEWRFGRRPCLFVARPEHVHEMFAGLESTYTRTRHPHAFRMLLGEGLVSSHGEQWRRKRAIVQPAVRPRQVRAYTRTMAHCSEEFADGWKPGDRIDVRREMMALSQRIAVRTLFGTDTEGRESDIGAAMEVAQHEVGAEIHGLGSLLPDWAPTPGRRRLRQAVARIDAEIARVIREHRRAPGERDDLLSRLLTAHDEHGRQLADHEIRDEAVTLYFAGHETTGTALSWTWYLLSRNPDVRARLTEELDRVLGGRAPGYADYPNLTWAQQIVKESLRLYPPVYMSTATATEQSVLGGRPVPEGTRIWTSQWATHRDPRWFPEPEAFRPERWDEELNSLVPDHAWHPFGLGPRACPGARFATVVTVMVLATVGRRMHFEIDPGDVPPKPALTLQPGRDLLGTVTAV